LYPIATGNLLGVKRLNSAIDTGGANAVYHSSGGVRMESIFAPVNSTLNITGLTCCNHLICAHTPPNEWQWFLTFRLPFPSFRRKVKDYLLQLQLVEGIQLGYIETYSPIEKRIHVMAIGFSIKTGKTLKEVCKVKWAERWCLSTRFLNP
jgi:hypothetical protein